MVKILNKQQALAEAKRCLSCASKPCASACPAGLDPCFFINSVKSNNFEAGIKNIRENNAFGLCCGLVCPQEKYCQKVCLRAKIDAPIKIGDIQAFLINEEKSLNKQIINFSVESCGKKVAIIGGGPSGLQIARDLSYVGITCDIFEAKEKLGGMLRYGIPNFRLSDEEIDHDINQLLNDKIEVHTSKKLFKDVSLDKLTFEYDAVVLATGLWKANEVKMFTDNKYLVNAVNVLMDANSGRKFSDSYKNILVVGGGDLAMDVATILKNDGVEQVSVVARKPLSVFRANKKDLNHAVDSFVSIFDGFIPQSIDKNEVSFKHINGLNNLLIKADLIVLAFGQSLEDSVAKCLKFDEKWNIIHKNYQLPESNIYVCGDIVDTDKKLVTALKTAKECAKSIIKNLGVK